MNPKGKHTGEVAKRSLRPEEAWGGWSQIHPVAMEKLAVEEYSEDPDSH